MSMQKLTAGDGYTYLTRQVVAHDATNRGYDNLGEYYSEKGEAPGVWMGRGLSGVPEFPLGEHVTEDQMKALFGEGRHPNADDIERSMRAAGASQKEIDRSSRLGSPYRIFEQANMFHRRCAGAFRDYMRMNLDIDVCGVLPSVRVPTLVLQRTEIAVMDLRGGRDLADRIAGALLVVGTITVVGTGVGAVSSDTVALTVAVALVTAGRCTIDAVGATPEVPVQGRLALR